MGCPQSKEKNISGDGTSGDVTKTGAQKLKSDDDTASRMPTKTIHAYNDDPLVKGRTDDVDIKVPSLAEDSAKGVTPIDTSVNSSDSNKSRNNVDADRNGLPQSEISDSQYLNDSNRTESSTSEKTTFAESETLAEAKRRVKEETDICSKNVSSGRKLPNVFIPDETANDVADDKLINDVKSMVTNGDVDLNDVNISPVINEISLENQVLNPDQPTGTSGSPVTSSIPVAPKSPSEHQEIQTPDGQLFKDTNSPWEGKSTIRYVSQNKIAYGLPEGAPRPAPPKSRKSEIVTPTTFTVADKIVDQAPDDAFSSITKLSTYLSGTKKSEVNAMSADDDENGDLPPPKPVTTKKKDLIPDMSVFRAIDENARNTPDTVRLSVDRLTAHLTSVATTDIEKVRAIYCWICNNISYVYDKEKTLSDKIRFDAVSTLRQGQGSYVNLMKAMCKEVGISCVVIPGCSKGLRHQPDKEFAIEERNHSWNAVYIRGEWRFVDCTWGSGFLDTNRKFQQQFDDFWFFTDPEVFVYDHFPAHASWQLLEHPVEIDEFNKKPSLTEKSRELGFRLISHREPIVYFENEVTVSFGTDTYPLSNITSDLNSETEQEINQYRCMRRIDQTTFEVRIVPPEVGEYTLILYGKAKDYRHAKYRKLMEYTLRCESVYEEKVIFPGHSKAWGPEPNYSELGFTDSIQTQSVFKSVTGELSIELEQTNIVPIIAELKTATDYKTEIPGCVLITARENTKIIHVRFPNSGYFRLDVYAEGKSEKYEYAALFLLQCTVDSELKPFPLYNADSVSKHVCDVIEPRDLELPSNATVTFRLRSLGLRNAMVGIPSKQQYGERMKGLGELKKTDEMFEAEITTPGPGETLLLSGCAAPPNVFWTRVYEYRTK